MSDETKPAEKPPDAPQYLSKAEVEQMLEGQRTAILGQITPMLQRVTEALTTAKPVGTPAPAAPDPQKRDWYNRPDEAADDLFNKKMAPLVETYAAGESNRQLGEVLSLPNAGDFKGEIEQVYNSIPPELRIRPGAARGVYDLVMGRHFDDIVKKRQETQARAPEFTETGGSGAAPPSKSAKLTDEEKKVAAATGMPEDEYIKWRDNRDEMASKAVNPARA